MVELKGKKVTARYMDDRRHYVENPKKIHLNMNSITVETDQEFVILPYANIKRIQIDKIREEEKKEEEE